jgi:hypothetical protein
MLPHSSRGIASAFPSGWPANSVSGLTCYLDDGLVVGHTGGVGERCTDVVNGVAVRPVSGLLVDEDWVKEILEQDRVCVDGDGVEGVDYCLLLVQFVWLCPTSSLKGPI